MSAAAPTEQAGPAPLGPAYRRVFASSLSSNLGDGIGMIAFPWLASAITRQPLLIALVAVGQRLPWLLFTLPAGVITDRVDRRRAMLVMDVARAILVAAVGAAVLARQGSLPTPDALDTVIGTDLLLYSALLTATVLLGSAEVLRDNAAQTILPAVVPTEQLERANGRLWAAESIANTFAGPPLASILLGVGFALPFLAHAGSFAVSAIVLATLSGTFHARPAEPPTSVQQVHPRPTWREDLAEGVRWLWGHPLLRTMAVVLGILNGAMALTMATFVLFAQEVLGIGPLLFTVLGFGGAFGGVLGGVIAPRLTARLGPGRCLMLVLVTGATATAAIGASSHWAPVLALTAMIATAAIVWNVITVSLRQAIIPAGLLGRVNSVYRFFGWGMMPIGAALGGVIVVLVGVVADRDLSLRSVWFVSAALQLGLLGVTRRRLTTEAIESARRTAEPRDVVSEIAGATD